MTQLGVDPNYPPTRLTGRSSRTLRLQWQQLSDRAAPPLRWSLIRTGEWGSLTRYSKMLYKSYISSVLRQAPNKGRGVSSWTCTEGSGAEHRGVWEASEQRWVLTGRPLRSRSRAPCGTWSSLPCTADTVCFHGLHRGRSWSERSFAPLQNKKEEF